MEKLGLGPDVLLSENERLIYARLSGFGQSGPASLEAGHDINYIARSGVLSIVGRRGDRPMFASNLVADFAGGGLMCALGIVMAVVERHQSQRGQVVDAGMSDGAAYLASFVFNARDVYYSGERGTNLLDGGAPFYDVYETADGKYMAVGAIEPQFFANLLRVLNVEIESHQMDSEQWPAMATLFARRFREHTRDEWARRFDGQEACVSPVLTMDEMRNDAHMCARGVVLDDVNEIAAAPRLSRTAGYGKSDKRRARPSVGQHSRSVLRDAGFSNDEISELIKRNIVQCRDEHAKL